MLLEAIKVTDVPGYEAAVAIRHRVFVEEQGVPAALEIDAYEGEATFFLVKAEGRALGTGRFRRKGSLLKFERIATLPEARKRGVGSALMRTMEAEGLRVHPRYLPYMHAQIDAVAFYEALGWSRVGVGFREAGIDHFAMAKPPADPALLRQLLCLSDPDAPEAAVSLVRALLR